MNGNRTAAPRGAGPAQILEAARAGGRTSLLEHEVYALLAGAGFDVPRHVFWEGEPGDPPRGVQDFLEGVRQGARSSSRSRRRISPTSRTSGGLSFSGKSPSSVAAAAKTMWDVVGRRAPGAERLGILVVEKLVPAGGTPAAEALLSFKNDVAFGPVLVLRARRHPHGVVRPDGSGGAPTAILRPGEVKQGLEAAVEKRPALKIFFESSRAHARGAARAG